MNSRAGKGLIRATKRQSPKSLIHLHVCLPAWPAQGCSLSRALSLRSSLSLSLSHSRWIGASLKRGSEQTSPEENVNGVVGGNYL